jgi:hypothetical protein
MKKVTLSGVLTMLVLAALTLGTALAASGNLPGGTSIEVAIDDPVTCTDLFIPVGETTLDVAFTGTASIGEGAVIKDTTVVYVMDVSGSMSANAGVDCDGVPGNDTRLRCEQEAVKAANTAAAAPSSSADETGLASFATTGTAHDVDLGAGGTQHIVAPDHDGNSNSTPDIEDVAFSLGTWGMTCYHCGLSQALTILGSSTNSINVVIFMSDGSNNTGPHVNTLAGSFGAGTTIHSFAMGVGVSCSSDSAGKGSLDAVAALTPGGTCTQVTDVSKLADLITQAIGSTLDSLEIEVDGGGKSIIDNAEIDPDLPQDGPATVNYATTVHGLGVCDHEICVTANGTDAGGSGSVEECVTIHLIQMVEIDIKPGSYPNSINMKSKGKIPVAILSNPTFDAPDQVDPESPTFGHTGTEDSLAFCNPSSEDVNDDGLLDLVCHFNTPDTDFIEGDEMGILQGLTGDGHRFRGTDSVRIVHGGK